MERTGSRVGGRFFLCPAGRGWESKRRPMCNLYDLGPAPERLRFEWEEGLRALLGELSYVAPGKPGLVATGAGERFQPVVMRWGFRRPWSPAITNARDDKLAGRTWADAWRNRRCVLPVRQFYEWSGMSGRKTKHAIRTEESDVWFWIGGLWEENPVPPRERSYAMVTTAASPQVAFLHGRMPLILAPGHVEEYVFARQPPLALVKPYEGVLTIQPPPPSREETGELF